MNFQIKTEQEFQKMMKPVRKRKLISDLGDDGFKLLEKALKSSEKLTKKVKAMETRIDNIMARVIALEGKDNGHSGKIQVTDTRTES